MLAIGTLLFILIALMIAAWPKWSHSAHWGYYPSCGFGAVAFGIVTQILLDRI